MERTPARQIHYPTRTRVARAFLPANSNRLGEFAQDGLDPLPQIIMDKSSCARPDSYPYVILLSIVHASQTGISMQETITL